MRGPRLLMLVLVGVLALFGCGGDKPDAPDPATTTGGEIFLDPAVEPGDDPFTADAANPIGNADQTPIPATADEEGEVAVTSVEGTQTGLYAVGDQPSCEVEEIIADLQADPDAAAAWAGVVGIETAEIPAYLRGLAPVVLRSDTRVTNHNYRDGVAIAFQSVLQAGTAVLVDGSGMPVVRCACGNPLLAPQAQTAGAQYVGDPWPGFLPTRVIVVVPGAPVESITCVHVDDPGRQVDVPVPGVPTADSPSATPSSDSGQTDGDYTSCARRYGELVRDLTLAGGIDPADASRWAGQAEQAATLANGGDLAGAYEICWQTVSEMEAALGG